MKIWLLKQFLVVTFIECVIWWTNKHHSRLDEHYTISECDADAEYEHWELNTIEWEFTNTNHFILTSHISHPNSLVYNVDMPTINDSFETNDAMAIAYWFEVPTWNQF